jgi:hypothetical protein
MAASLGAEKILLVPGLDQAVEAVTHEVAGPARGCRQELGLIEQPEPCPAVRLTGATALGRTSGGWRLARLTVSRTP